MSQAINPFLAPAFALLVVALIVGPDLLLRALARRKARNGELRSES